MELRWVISINHSVLSQSEANHGIDPAGDKELLLPWV